MSEVLTHHLFKFECELCLETISNYMEQMLLNIPLY